MLSTVAFNTQLVLKSRLEQCHRQRLNNVVYSCKLNKVHFKEDISRMCGGAGLAPPQMHGNVFTAIHFFRMLCNLQCAFSLTL